MRVRSIRLLFMEGTIIVNKICPRFCNDFFAWWAFGKAQRCDCPVSSRKCASVFCTFCLYYYHCRHATHAGSRAIKALNLLLFCKRIKVAEENTGLTLPVSGARGSIITWTSDNSAKTFTLTVKEEPRIAIFVSAVQNGGISVASDSTGLTLTFSVDPITSTAGNITVSGATKGLLSGNGTERLLSISNITVANGATVSIAITSPSGFTINGSPKTAVVYRAP